VAALAADQEKAPEIGFRQRLVTGRKRIEEKNGNK
jgi:hypothetical protein